MMEPFTTDEQRLRLAVSLSGMGLLEVDYRIDTVIADQRAAELFDLPAGVAVSRSELHSRLHPDDREGIQRQMDSSLRPDGAGQFTTDYRIVRRDGSVRWLNVRKQVSFVDGKPTRGLLAAIDITDRKAYEHQMHQSHETFRQVVEDNPFGVYVIDDDFQFLYVSQGAEQTFSSTMPLVGRDFAEVIHATWPEPFASEAIERFESTMRTGQPYTAPLLIEQRVDRQVVESYEWKIKRVSLPNNRYGVVCYYYDATERQRWEQSLRTSESRLRLAAAATGFGTYDYDAIANTLVWSPELFHICGLPSDYQPVQDAVRSIVHPDDVCRYDAAVANAHQSDGPEVHHEEYRIVRHDGQTRWIVDTGRILRQRDGDASQIHRIVGTVQDITARKQFEQSLQKAKQSAEAASQSRGEFLANMSHEIRTPMAAILGHADILKDHLVNPDNLQVVETIRRNGNYLLNIINDILDLSKIDAGKMTIDRRPTRPDQIVGEIRSLMDVRASEKKLPLKIVFDGPIPETVETDPVRLRQVLLNLVGNAIKFTHDGEVRLVVRFAADKSRLVFDVIDTGIGIPPGTLESLFEPFVQVDNTSTRSIGGTGLGLTICRRLASALGGTIVAESELDKGSRFTLSIKAIKPGQLIEPNLTLASATSSPKNDIRLSATVLVVDDRRDIRYLAQHFIEKAGGKVHTATNGQEAIDFIESQSTPDIDLVVMDMQMPVMDGYKATSELRRRGCQLPIIALTANAMKEDRDECLAAGCSDYTTKPLDSHKLVELIERLTS